MHRIEGGNHNEEAHVKGLSWDRIKVRVAALATLALLLIPGVASAADTLSAPNSDTVVTYDFGTVKSFSYGTYSRGTSWS